MPTKDIESLLLPWYINSRPKQRVQRRAGVRWIRMCTPPVAPEPKRVTPSTHVVLAQLAARALDTKHEEANTDWVVDETRKPCIGAVKEEQNAMAICEVIRFDGEEAECSVRLSGYEMPRVSFPAWAIRAKNLKEGSRFIWVMRDTGYFSPADIDTEMAQAPTDMNATQKAEIEDLYADSKRREVEGEDWTEYTDSGQ